MKIENNWKTYTKSYIRFWFWLTPHKAFTVFCLHFSLFALRWRDFVVWWCTNKKVVKHNKWNSVWHKGPSAVIYSQKMWWKRYREVKMLLILHPHVSSAHVSEREYNQQLILAKPGIFFPCHRLATCLQKEKTVCQTLNVTFFIRIFLILWSVSPHSSAGCSCS